jgi:ABC-type multidrug transport system ATPase subunit
MTRHAHAQGSSGAGKSTLMDVLARRKTGGKITGEILVNGRPTDANLSRVIGYVEQQDLHVPTQTILEAIEFSAFVRSLLSNAAACLPHTLY